MKTQLFSNENYSIVKGCKKDLYNIAEFVVRQNYIHHVGKFNKNIQEEIWDIYHEEFKYFESSNLYIAKDNNGDIIGCIRTIKWNFVDVLPIQKIFNINLCNLIARFSNPIFWHIGRFAINSKSNTSRLTLFKQLMTFAIKPICAHPNNYFVAECDSKLLYTMNLLGMKTRKLSEGIFYLGSETIPVYSNREGLMEFYNKHKYLC